MIFYIHSNNTLIYLPCPGLSPLKNKFNKLLFFTPGSIDSTNASGAKQSPETNKFESNIHVNGLRESLLARGKPVGYLQAWSRIYLVTSKKNPVSDQSGTWTWGLWIASPVL